MRLHHPETPYEKMIYVALANKVRNNHQTKKRSFRDGIREYNSTHEIQLPMRPRKAPASLYTHVTEYTVVVERHPLGFIVDVTNERKSIG